MKSLNVIVPSRFLRSRSNNLHNHKAVELAKLYNSKEEEEDGELGEQMRKQKLPLVDLIKFNSLRVR